MKPFANVQKSILKNKKYGNSFMGGRNLGDMVCVYIYIYIMYLYLIYIVHINTFA